MEETHKFFEPTPSPAQRDETIVHEPDRTLATPRFGEVEAQVARPVVPLAGRPPRSARRQWPIALVLISALAGGVVSLLAFRLYQQRQSRIVATEVNAQTPVATDATQSPEQAGGAVQATEQQAQSETPVVFEEFDPAKEGGAVSDAAPSRPKATTEAVAAAAAPERRDEARDEAKDEPKPKPRLVETLGPRRTESSPAPRQVEARHEDVVRDAGGDEDEFRDRRRERRRQRREQRREQRRNIDRIKDIFEGAPPS